MERCLIEAVRKNEPLNNQFRTNFDDIKRLQMDEIVKAREIIQREIDDLKKSIIDGQEFLRMKSEELQSILNSKEDEVVAGKQEVK